MILIYLLGNPLLFNNIYYLKFKHFIGKSCSPDESLLFNNVLRRRGGRPGGGGGSGLPVGPENIVKKRIRKDYLTTEPTRPSGHTR